METKAKKITKATIKSFIKREMSNGKLYIKHMSDFDGMVDCVMPVNGEWKLAQPTTDYPENTLGVKGAYVTHNGNLFSPFADDNFIGYNVYNCCGSFLLAMPRR